MPTKQATVLYYLAWLWFGGIHTFEGRTAVTWCASFSADIDRTTAQALTASDPCKRALGGLQTKKNGRCEMQKRAKVAIRFFGCKWKEGSVDLKATVNGVRIGTSIE